MIFIFCFLYFFWVMVGLVLLSGRLPGSEEGRAFLRGLFLYFVS